MERLDYYEHKPRLMGTYLKNYGWHFSKAMCEWATSMIKDRYNNKFEPYSLDKVTTLFAQNGIELKNNLGYDAVYVMNMAKADFLGSSLPDEYHLLLFVKDYLDDIDGSSTRAFDEFYAKCIALGIPIIWEDML